MPGHGVMVPVGTVLFGGARGCCVKDRGDADPGTEVLWVRRDRQHRLRRRLEQQVLDQGLVLPGDIGDLGGNCSSLVERKLDLTPPFGRGITGL